MPPPSCFIYYIFGPGCYSAHLFINPITGPNTSTTAEHGKVFLQHVQKENPVTNKTERLFSLLQKGGKEPSLADGKASLNPLRSVQFSSVTFPGLFLQRLSRA